MLQLENVETVEKVEQGQFRLLGFDLLHKVDLNEKSFGGLK